jgi:predicted ATP-grasp superfamily ATP-dependent carboligase
MVLIPTAGTNGKVMVAGGWDGSDSLDSMELFDINTETWSSGPKMTTARYDFGMVLIPTARTNGKVMIAGGSDGGSILDSMELFDINTETWSSGPKMNTARYDFGMVLIPTAGTDGKVMIAGGWDERGY